MTDDDIIAIRKATPLFTSGVPWENSLAFAREVLVASVDCRTCNAYGRKTETCYAGDICTNADRYQPLPPVRLWRTT